MAGCLFVVDCREGWRAQSEEHLRILELLGVRHGVVALTKVAGVDDDLVDLVRLEVLGRTSGTFLERAVPVATDALDGTGLGDLVVALDELVTVVPPARDVGRPRLWIDRVFAARGAGTVVTGTLAGGAIVVGDGARRGRRRRRAAGDPPGSAVRGVQSLHRTIERAGAGARGGGQPGRRAPPRARSRRRARPRRPVAPHHRGRCRAPLFLATLAHPVTRRGAYVVHLGSGEHPATLRVIDGDRLDPGSVGPVRIRWRRPVPLLPGDRVALRVRADEARRWAAARSSRSTRSGRRHGLVPTGPWLASWRRTAGSRSMIWRGAPASTSNPPSADGSSPPRRGRRRRRPASTTGSTGPGRSASTWRRSTPRDRAVLGLLTDVVVAAGRATRRMHPDPLGDHPFLRAAIADPFHPPTDAGSTPASRGPPPAGLACFEHDGIVFVQPRSTPRPAWSGPWSPPTPGDIGVGPLR